MRAILIGGPRHLNEFEIGTPPPLKLLTPKPEPMTLPLSVSDDPHSVAKPFFQTVEYHLVFRDLGGYAIYAMKESI